MTLCITLYLGYVDMGGDITDQSKVASEALVIMAVGMKAGWKAPISYHLTRGCSAETQKQLILLAIAALAEKDILVRVLTMDGCSTNISTAKHLGCDLVKEVYTFKHESRDICVALDACHMIKVLRNCFHDLQEIITPDGTARWEDIELLVKIQNEGQLHLANKLTSRHIQYENNKMKVKLAVQIFSQSTADALITLSNCGQYPELRNSKATAQFLKVTANMNFYDYNFYDYY